MTSAAPPAPDMQSSPVHEGSSQSMADPLERKRSGQVPAGDVRLTVNIRQDLHLKLKIAAAERRTTIGQLIEEWVEKHL